MSNDRGRRCAGDRRRRCPRNAHAGAAPRRGGLLRSKALRADAGRAHRGRAPGRSCRRTPPAPGSGSAPPRERVEPTATEQLGPRAGGFEWMGGSPSAQRVPVGRPAVHGRARTRPATAANPGACPSSTPGRGFRLARCRVRVRRAPPGTLARPDVRMRRDALDREPTTPVDARHGGMDRSARVGR